MSHGTPDPNDVRDFYRGQVAEDTQDAAGTAYIQKFIDMAERMHDDVFSGRIRTVGEVEGDQDDFVLFLACHLITIAEGGEVGSDSQTGGSVSYSHLQGNVESTLTETRYGRLARSFLRDEASYGVEFA